MINLLFSGLRDAVDQAPRRSAGAENLFFF